MARGNVPATCVAFKRLLRRNDDRSLPLVEKICHSMCFWGRKPPLNRQGPDRGLFFCAAFSFTSYYEERQGSNNNSQKNDQIADFKPKNTGIHQR